METGRGNAGADRTWMLKADRCSRSTIETSHRRVHDRVNDRVSAFSALIFLDNTLACTRVHSCASSFVCPSVRVLPPAFGAVALGWQRATCVLFFFFCCFFKGWRHLSPRTTPSPVASSERPV